MATPTIGNPGAAGRVLDVLSLVERQDVVTVEDVVVRWGVSVLSVRRTLDLLVDGGYLTTLDDGRTYEGGPALVRVGMAVQRRSSLAQLAQPTLGWMAKESRETAHLAVRDGLSLRFVLGIEGHQAAVGTRAKTGEVVPAYTTSLGRRLLAELDDQQLRALLPDEELPTPYRLFSSRTDLFTELWRIRGQGFAISYPEALPPVPNPEDDVGSTSQAVPRLAGPPFIGVAISAPRTRLDDATRRAHREILDRASEELRFLYDIA